MTILLFFPLQDFSAPCNRVRGLVLPMFVIFITKSNNSRSHIDFQMKTLGNAKTDLHFSSEITND